MSIAPIELDDIIPQSTGETHHASHIQDAGDSSEASSSELLRQCSQRMYHEFQWTVPFPRVPKTPLLYTPSVLGEVFDAGTSIMSSELDAMKTGVIDAIPVAHFPTAPRELRMTMHAVCEPVALDPKDAELLDTDIDADLLDRRGMPSLTLLKRPLYTEIGLVPPEERSTKRLARLMPSHLAGRGGSVVGTQMTLGGLSQGQHTALGLSQQAADDLDPTSSVVKKVNESFKFAKAVDHEFQSILDGIRIKKLGLGGAVSDMACVELTRQFWATLFDGTNGAQQRAVWLAVCQFVRQVLQVEGEAPLPTAGAPLVASLESKLEALHLPNLPRWLAWARSFASTLDEVDQVRARSKLEHGPHDRTPTQAAQQRDDELTVFKASIDAKVPLDRTSSRLMDPIDQRSRLKIYPLSVIPVLPSGYDVVMERLSRGEDASTCPLANRPGTDVVQLLVRAMGDSTPRKGCFEPHIFAGKHLFEAKPDPERLTCVSSDVTLHVKSPPNSVFEEILHDGSDSTTLLLDINDNVCVYDCIRTRKEFRRGPAELGDRMPEFVVCFKGDDGVVDRKRPREE